MFLLPKTFKLFSHPMFGYDRTWWRFLQKCVMCITVDINVCTTSMMFTQLYIRVGILLTCWKHWKTWAHITSLLLYFLLTKWSRLKNILLYKMYPSWCINCIVSLQGQIPTFILVTCLLYISSDNKNKVKNLSFPYLDSKTIHTYTPWHIDIQEETSIIPALYVLQVGV